MADLTGQQIGSYVLVDKLGEGAMGVVYRARELEGDREVAVKVVRGEVAVDAERLVRFEREARAAASLDHPNVLRVYEVGSHRGRPFIVTELLRGRSLREMIDSGALTSGMAADYATQIASALEAAHERGIVHRDLKPENVFVTTRDRVKVLDFGLAKLVDPAGGGGGVVAGDALPPTSPGLALGTIGYMAPEQIRGEPVDGRADIFALGVVLYEMLTGLRPFRRVSVADTISAVLSENPPRPSQNSSRVPPLFDGIVRRCLAKRPEDRYQTAREVGSALEDARTVGVPRRWQAPAPPPRSVWGLVVIIAVVVAAVLALALLLSTYRTMLHRDPGTPPGRQSLSLRESQRRCQAPLKMRRPRFSVRS